MEGTEDVSREGEGGPSSAMQSSRCHPQLKESVDGGQKQPGRSNCSRSLASTNGNPYLLCTTAQLASGRKRTPLVVEEPWERNFPAKPKSKAGFGGAKAHVRTSGEPASPSAFRLDVTTREEPRPGEPDLVSRLFDAVATCLDVRGVRRPLRAKVARGGRAVYRVALECLVQTWNYSPCDPYRHRAGHMLQEAINSRIATLVPCILGIRLGSVISSRGFIVASIPDHKPTMGTCGPRISAQGGAWCRRTPGGAKFGPHADSNSSPVT